MPKTSRGRPPAPPKSNGPAEQVVDEDLLKQQFWFCLEQLKKGNLFVEQDLSEGDLENLLDEEGRPPEKNAKKHAFNRFLKVVVASVVEKERSAEKKTSKKVVSTQIRNSLDKWVSLIREFHGAQKAKRQSENGGATETENPPAKKRKKARRKLGPKGNGKGSKVPDDENDAHSDKDIDGPQHKQPEVEVDIGDEATGSKKRKRLKKTVSKSKKKKKKQTKLNATAKRKAEKEKFDAERDRVLAEVPDEVRSQFRQVGWGKWGKKEVLPVLFLGPYDINPGSVRNNWMSMFERTKGRRGSMSRIVYWYGTTDLHNAYSFLPKSKCISYEEGIEKGYDKTPRAIQKKLDAGKQLNVKEQELLQGLLDIKEAAERKPEERVIEVVEEYEGIESEIEEDEVEEEEEKNVPAVATDSKSKGVVDDEDDFAEAELSSDEEDAEAEIPESEDDDDLNDHDYAPDTTLGTKTKKGRKEANVTKKESKMPKKRQLDRKRSKKTNKTGSRRDQEQRAFEECEDLFFPMLNKWNSAIEKNDIKSLVSVMDELEDGVETMRRSFISAYELPQMMKRTKPLLKSDESNLEKYKSVWVKMKDRYTKGEKEPDGFKATKRRKIEMNQRPQTPSKKAQDGDSLERSTGGTPSRKKEKTSGILCLPQASASKGDELKDDRTYPGPGIDAVEITPMPSPGRIPKTKLAQEVSASSPIMSRASSNAALSSLQSASRSAHSKSEKKGFSLNTLIRPNNEKDPQAELTRNTAQQNLNGTSGVMPSWLTVERKVGTELPENEDRTFALEFLQSATVSFPSNKIDGKSIAIALEEEVFTWSKEHHKLHWIENYWRKVHMVTAAVCGKQNEGSTVNMMMDGKYETPRHLIMDEATLKSSFEE